MKHFDTELNFPLNQSIADYVLDFVAGVYDLGDLHIKYGAAGREIPFKTNPKGLPEGVVTKSKQKAGQVFDARQELGSFGVTGSIPSQNERREKTELLVVDRDYHPVYRQLPYFNLHDLETPQFVPTYYLPRRVQLGHVSGLYKLTNNGSNQWLNREVFSLLLLAGLLLPISASAPEHSVNIAMYGYSVHEVSDFIMDYWAAFDKGVSNLKKLFPDANLPASPIDLLRDLEQVVTSPHPLLPGVLLRHKTWIIVNHANVKDRLEKLLQFPNLAGGIGAKRGFHFEDAVQSYIDSSSWKPSRELRAMRQVHLLRSDDAKNKQITDIDAIGESGDTLLIISCKAVIFNSGQDIGEYQALKNARLRLDQAVLKWQAVKAELLASPIGQNYNFSRYRTIIAVVCTPNVAYTESELSLSYEIGKLRKAATAREFIDWLSN